MKVLKKTLLSGVFTLLSSIAIGQVGINTNNPQGSFHVDGAKDNPISGTPSVAQQANDFTVTSLGNVGIGTTVPTQKLEINGKIKITDGSQADGKVLTSDVNGVGTWKPMAFSTSIEGTWLINNYEASSNNSIPAGKYNSIAKLSLPSAGTYLVFLNADFGFVNGVAPSMLEYLVTKGPISNAVDLTGAIGAIPGTWNMITNSTQVGMGSFTINNTFFVVTLGPQDLYLTVSPYSNNNTGVTLQRWGNISESPSYKGIPGGLAIDRFVAYKF